MFTMRFSARLERIYGLHDLYPRSVAKLNEKFQNEIKPRIEADAQEVMAPYPGMVSVPFEFATDRSRKFYFANFKPPYQRTGELSHSWNVSVGAQYGKSSFIQRFKGVLSRGSASSDLAIIIANTDPASIWVYGPRQVPGHRNTGWGVLMRSRAREVVERAKMYVRAGWGTAVHEAMRGV